MRDSFFKLYIDIKVAERYFCLYTDRSIFWNNFITGLCLAASAATISSWAIWRRLSVVWAVIIAASQVLAVLRPLFKSSARLSAAKYLIPEMEFLLDDLANFWDEMNHVRDIPDGETLSAICGFRNRYTDIREKYASSELFPEKKQLHDLAQSDAMTFFSV